MNMDSVENMVFRTSTRLQALIMLFDAAAQNAENYDVPFDADQLLGIREIIKDIVGGVEKLRDGFTVIDSEAPHE